MKNLKLPRTFVPNCTLWFMVTGIFIAAGEYSLALVQHRVLVRARGWIRPWPGITCTPTVCNVLYCIVLYCIVLWCIVLCSGITCIQTTIHPDPLPSPFIDLPWTPNMLFADPLQFVGCLTLSRFRNCSSVVSDWALVSEWEDFSLFETSEVWFQSEPASQDDRRHTFQRETWCWCNVTKQKLDQN